MKLRKYVLFHFFSEDVDYTAFKNGLITLFGRLEFEDSYCQQLRELAQAGSESIASYAARTTDLTTQAYPKFPTELQLDIAVENFIAGLRDTSTRDYQRRKRARRSITCRKRSKWLKPASSHALRTGLLLTPPSRVTRRTRRSRTPHRAPRRRATIAQSRRHAQLATPATHEVVMSTLRARTLHGATGAPPIWATPPRRQSTC